MSKKILNVAKLQDTSYVLDRHLRTTKTQLKNLITATNLSAKSKGQYYRVIKGISNRIEAKKFIDRLLKNKSEAVNLWSSSKYNIETNRLTHKGTKKKRYSVRRTGTRTKSYKIHDAVKMFWGRSNYVESVIRHNGKMYFRPDEPYYMLSNIADIENLLGVYNLGEILFTNFSGIPEQVYELTDISMRAVISRL